MWSKVVHDSIAVDDHSGFSEVELQNWLELKPGIPFEKESLLSAQENLAFELQSVAINIPQRMFVFG